MREIKTPKKEIAKKSDKMKQEDKMYNSMVKKYLKDNPKCKVYPELKSEQVHHKRGRGKYKMDVSTWLAVSFKAHRKIEDDPEWAYEMGYSELRLKNYDE